MSNLARRLATAAIGIPVLLAINHVGGRLFAFVLVVAAYIGGQEAFRMTRLSGFRPFSLLGIVAGCALAAIPFICPEPQSAWVAVLFGTLLVSTCYFLLPANYGPNMASWSLTVMIALYIGLGLGHAGLLRASSDGERWVLLLLVITWTYDTGAYAGGRLWGRRPFASHISPSKTVEGVQCGLIASTLAAVASAPLIGIPIVGAGALGLVGGVAAQTGDLLASALKRQAGVKDSGSIMPGHGGLLDRIDSLLFVSMTVYYGARLFGYVA